jgi:hypothetical protein
VAEDKSIDAERAMTAAGGAMDRLDVETAEEKLRDARELLDEPAAAHYPDHTFLMQQLEREEKRLVEVKAEVEKRRLEEAVTLQTQKVEALLGKLDEALRPLDGSAVTKDQIEAAIEARSDVREQLTEGDPLVPRSDGYRVFATKTLDGLDRVEKVLDRANTVVAFTAGPVAKSVSASELVAKAEAEEDPAERVPLLLEARGELEACAKSAKSMAASAPELGKMAFDVGGKGLSPKALEKSCTTRAKALAKQIDKLKKKLAAKPKPKAKAKPKAKPKMKKK